MESLEVGIPFCEEINAIDSDIGLDGEFNYSFIPDTASPEIGEIVKYFEFNKDKNSLVLLKQIDFEELNNNPIFFFQLKVSYYSVPVIRFRCRKSY